jgi:hypothetical protein
MNNAKISMVLVSTVAILFSGCVGLNSIKPQSSSKKARIIFEVPSSVDLNTVNSALKNAIASRSTSFQDNENFVPEVLPDVAGAPVNKEVIGGGLIALAGGNPTIASMNTDISGATYSIKGTEEIGTPFNKKQMAYIGAVYPSKNITKVYLLVYYQEGSDGVIGALAKAGSDAIVGADGALPFTLQIEEKFLQNLTSAKVVSATPQELNTLKLNSINQVEKK